ncbi:MAG TPA: MaoC family dehydratase N-terminal domain-containing protein [Ktedonobacteraceae bacterium]
MFETRFIGHSFPAFIIEVERAKLREFALALGQTDLIYHSRQEAQAAGYEDVQMLPTVATQFEFWGNPGWMERLREIGLDTTRLLHLEQEFEYPGAIVPGDILTGVTRVVDGKARRGLDMVTLETRYTNQRDEHVLTARMKVVVREQAVQ